MEKEKPSLSGVWFYLKPFTMRLATFASWGTVALLWLNFLWQPWPVSANPIQDFLFMRSGGPLLYANHVSSEVAIMGVITYCMIKDKAHAPRIFLVVASFIPLHEIILPLVDFPISTLSGVGNGFYFTGSAGALKYLAELSILLIIGILIATHAERKRIAKSALVITAYTVVWVATLVAFNVGRITINGFVPGPDFFNPFPNAFEVGGWIVAALTWVPKVE